MHLYFSMFGNRIKFLKKHTFTYALKFKIIFQITKKKEKTNKLSDKFTWKYSKEKENSIWEYVEKKNVKKLTASTQKAHQSVRWRKERKMNNFI